MGKVNIEISPSKYYQEAKKMLEKKDLVGFASKISVAVETSMNDEELLARSTFLRSKGLIDLHQYSKALEYIEEALKYNTGDAAFNLKKYKGVAKGYLGKNSEEIKKALELFKKLAGETDKNRLLFGVYLNIVWVYLTLFSEKTEQNLTETKMYLDLINEHFDTINDDRKVKLLNSYSVYYFYRKKYDKAIEVLKSSLNYCDDNFKTHIYNNLAELYLKVSQEEESDVLDESKNYLKEAELLATSYKDSLALGYIFYTKAMIEVYEDQLFTGLDTLYLAFDYFKEANANIKACETLIKINELMDEYKLKNLKELKDNLKKRLNDTSYFDRL